MDNCAEGRTAAYGANETGNLLNKAPIRRAQVNSQKMQYPAT
jgi:hypothetical protein